MTESERLLVTPSDTTQIPLWEVDDEGQPEGGLAVYVTDDIGNDIAYLIIEAVPREFITTSIADDGVARVELVISAKRFSELTDKLVDVSNRLDSGVS